MILDTTRHVNPGDTISGPLIIPVPFDFGVLLDIQDTSSYFKFNLDYMIVLQPGALQPQQQPVLGAYVDVRNYTANHQNPFFDLIDHALRGANSFDTEVQPLLDQWLLRPKRDLYVDDSKVVKTCSAPKRVRRFPCRFVRRPISCGSAIRSNWPEAAPTRLKAPASIISCLTGWADIMG